MIQPGSSDALLVIDMQRDFMPGGPLGVPGGDTLLPVINRLGHMFANIVLTQDWHPARHISFASTHGKQPFVDTAEASYGTQALWPEHTIQGSSGAELHPDLELSHAGLIVRKGFRPDVDSYSAFLENDHKTGTGLAGYLRERDIRRLFLCGVATDFCVGFSALDGKTLGFEVVVVRDAVLGIADEATATMSRRWVEQGIATVHSGDLST